MGRSAGDILFKKKKNSIQKIIKNRSEKCKIKLKKEKIWNSEISHLDVAFPPAFNFQILGHPFIEHSLHSTQALRICTDPRDPAKAVQQLEHFGCAQTAAK